MSLIIQKEGLFTSLQNLGDHGSQRFGINPRGAMDPAAITILNILLGNTDDDHALELHFPAGQIQFERPCRFAVGGADFNPRLNGDAIDLWRVSAADAGDVLSFGRKAKGNRAYVGVESGLVDPRIDQTDPATRFTTKRLARGSRLSVNNENVATGGTWKALWASHTLIPAYAPFPTVRFIEGPEFGRLTEESKRNLENSTFDLSADSNRMGFRMQGPDLHLDSSLELASAAVAFGTVQLLPGGQVIVLMADHQTTGGYPRIGTVATVDLPLLGQLGPGDRVAFEPIEIDAAEQAYAEFKHNLNLLRTGVRVANKNNAEAHA